MNKNIRSVLILTVVAVFAVGLFVAARFVTNGQKANLGVETLVNEDVQNASPAAAPKGNGNAGASVTASPDAEARAKEAAQRIAKLTFTDKDGKTVTFKDFHGKYLIINYWASWCPPCKAEMPEMQEFYDKHKDEKDFLFIALNSTGGRETKESAEAYIKGQGYTFPVYFDTTQQVGMTLGLSSLPSTFALGPDGQPGYLMVGRRSLSDFENLLSEMRANYPQK